MRAKFRPGTTCHISPKQPLTHPLIPSPHLSFGSTAHFNDSSPSSFLFVLPFTRAGLGYCRVESKCPVVQRSPSGGTMAHLPVYGTIVCTGGSTLEKPFAPPNLGQPQYAHATESHYASPSGLCLPKVSCYGRVHLSSVRCWRKEENIILLSLTKSRKRSPRLRRG